MSYLVTIKIKGNVDVFKKALTERAKEFAAFGQRAKAAGAIHHRFGVGHGEVLVIDEWKTAEAFKAFFSDPALQAFVGTVGANTSTPPDITIAEAVASADEF